MGNKEEAEWVLERLTTTLNRELETMRREELEREGGDGGENLTKDKPGEGG
jgi:potassium channel subfamily K, other eukaryote